MVDACDESEETQDGSLSEHLLQEMKLKPAHSKPESSSRMMTPV